MKKNILFSGALCLFAVPLTVNAATNADRATVDFESQTIIAGFGFIEDTRSLVEGANELINDTEEDGDAINTGVGTIKSKVSGGENAESNVVVEEVQVQEGAETTEILEDSGDSF